MSLNIPAREAFPEPARAANIEIGRGDSISTLWRLTRMELYKLRRRTYAKVVLFILLCLIALAVLALGFFSLSQASSPASSLVPPTCSATRVSRCTTQTYSPAELAQIKNKVMQGNAGSLGFPGSFTTVAMALSEGFIALLGLALLGSLAGTEYGLGTIRLLFTRGPTRLQCMLAKVLAGLIYTAVVLLLLIVVYIAVGMLVYPMAGEPYSYTFGLLHAANFAAMFGNTLLLVLIALGYWFAYGMMALFFGTLGRSTAAALGGAFAWYVVETLLTFALNTLQSIVPTGPIHDLANALPNYLLTVNFSALVQNRLHALAGQDLSSITDVHALIVVACYLAFFIGGACLLAARRDVTN